MKAEGPDVTTAGGGGESLFLFVCLGLVLSDKDRALVHNFLVFCSLRNLVLLLEISRSK